jgi:cytochrome b
MPVMHRLRAYHALLVVLAIAAYATGELGLIHAWLGYAVSAILLGRVLWALTGVPQLGLMRFYPQFEGLKLGNAMTHPAISRTLLLGIAVCLVGVSGTGIALDRGRAMGLAAGSAVAVALAKESTDKHAKSGAAKVKNEREESEGPLSELHELLANLLVGLVVLHVTYLLLFKWPLARFMLFLDGAKR